tara:strand:- start:2633 stop:2896 length:264 start_codon:yes stop_codon:yes gene_type:complete
MAWSWYPIKEISEVMKNGEPDEVVDLNLEGLEDTSLRFIQGSSVGIIFRNYLLFPNMNGRNPFTKDDKVGAMIYEGRYWVGINDNKQ